MSSQSKQRWQSVGAGAALALACSVPHTAQAGGIEDTVGGAIGLGRSAYFARVDDFMAVLQNPANLAVLPRGDLGAELRLPILTSCYDRQYNPMLADLYKKDEAGNLLESFDKVCNDAFPGPTANIGWARSYLNGLGWGIGLFTPAAAGGNATFGSSLVRTFSPNPNEKYTPTLTGTESAARQLGTSRDGVIAYLMLGLAYQPVKQLRFGASGGIGFASITNEVVASVTGGTFAASNPEIVNTLHVKDYSIPKATASMVIAPIDWIDIMGAFTYQGDIEGKGYSDLVANGITGAPRNPCVNPAALNPNAAPVFSGTHCRIEGATLRLPQPRFEATAGVRFVHHRNKRERSLNPMKDEIWDFEVDVTWSQTSHVDAFTAVNHTKVPSAADAPKIQFANIDGNMMSSPVPGTVIIPKHWDDSWTFRAGGDVNVMPDVLSLRAGASYAPRAMTPGFANIDFAMPIQKIGVHVGATLKLDRYRMTVAYAHLFYETIDVPLGTGQVKSIVAINEMAALPVNEGRFSGGLDVLSLQLNAAF
jgi:hypothetical protein